MAIKQQRVTVANTATRLDFSTAPTGRQFGQMAITVRNRGTVPIYVGGSDVTAADGLQLDPGEAHTFGTDRGNPGAFYGITASGTAVTHVLEVWT